MGRICAEIYEDFDMGSDYCDRNCICHENGGAYLILGVDITTFVILAAIGIFSWYMVIRLGKSGIKNIKEGNLIIGVIILIVVIIWIIG